MNSLSVLYGLERCSLSYDEGATAGGGCVSAIINLSGFRVYEKCLQTGLQRVY